MKINHKPINNSSMLRSSGWDPATGAMEVEYNSGARWQYQGVPQSVAEGVHSAASAGAYMNENIIGKYPGVKV